MATTRAILTPFSAEFPSSNFPGLNTVNARPVLAFDASTQETAYWTLVAPQGLTGALSCVCLLYTSDAADELTCVDLGGRRLIKKKTNNKRT